jgi:UDP-N-acetylglucosamine transferase subunit ALG13
VSTLFVAGTGGHLEELWLLRPRLVGVSEAVTWVVVDTPQSRSLLAGEDQVFIPPSRPRDPRLTLGISARAFGILRRLRPSQVVTAGSLPAVPFVVIARAMGIPCHFIESAARVTGPSLSARIVRAVPGVHRYCQYEWERPPWEYRGSVFDGFAPVVRPESPVRRIVVTVGANGYDFSRLLTAVKAVAPPDAEILWQTGSSDVSDLDIAAVPTMSSADLFGAMHRADVVVAHAGVGSAIMAMRAGKCPVMVPRERAHREHIDDHQKEIASTLARAGLAVTCDPASLDADILAQAAKRSILTNEQASPFVLGAN